MERMPAYDLCMHGTKLHRVKRLLLCTNSLVGLAQHDVRDLAWMVIIVCLW